MPPSPFIILLLGNPGHRYEATRHNLGWWVGDLLAQRAEIQFQAGWGQFYIANSTKKEVHSALIKPTTYMNLSGRAVTELAERLDVTVSRIIAVADDFALPLGQIRVRPSGSSGGHNGLASLIEVLQSEEFTRVRCGVGPVPEGLDPAEFVLAPFAENELPLAREMAERAAAAVEMILTEGVSAAANIFNRKPPAPDAPSGDQLGA